MSTVKAALEDYSAAMRRVTKAREAFDSHQRKTQELQREFRDAEGDCVTCRAALDKAIDEEVGQ